MQQGVPFFSLFVVFEPRIVNPPLPLVFMQNHPFIPRHACLAAISCPPVPPSALLFRRSPGPGCILITRTCLPSSHGQTPRNLFVNFTATTRKSTSINAPARPPLGTLFLPSLHHREISEFVLPIPPRRSHLTYRYLTETRRREGKGMILISPR